MSQFEAITLWIFAALYGAAWGAYLANRFFGKRAAALFVAGRVLLGIGFAVQNAHIIVRWMDVGHPPIFGTFESTLAAVWFMVGALLVFSRSWWLRNAPLGVIPVVFAILLFGLRFNTDHIPLTISEQSIWVEIHVVFAWMALASFVFAQWWALRYLVPKKAGEGDYVRATRDDLIFRALALGFVNLTLLLAIGSFYEFRLLGTWWSWDIVETLTLIAWLLYGLVMHLRFFYAWKGRRLALVMSLAFVVLLLAYWSIPFFGNQSFHMFDINPEALKALG